MTIAPAPPHITSLLNDNDKAGFLTGVRGETGTSPFVMQPQSTEEVAECVRHCVRHNLKYLPQSANTGLVGASVPDQEGKTAVLSCGKLRETFDLDLANRSLKVSAGFRLSEINDRLSSHGLFFPIDLGADPMIGGMVATNTGGTRFLRYGDVRQNVLGMTVVLHGPTADVLTLGSPVRKNNTGPDWKQNFIGTSGWFGVITEVIVNLEPVVQDQAAALVIPSSDEASLSLLQFLETRAGHLLSAFEFMSQAAMIHTFAHVPSLPNPFPHGDVPQMAVLVELSRTTKKAPWDTPLDEVLQAILAEAWELEQAPIKDAYFGRPEEIWALRHAISEGVKSAGPLIAFDLGFTRDNVIAFRSAMLAELPKAFGNIEICDFGHLGDGGLHFNLIKTDGPTTPEFETVLRDWVVKRAVQKFNGSYSAEHGIGPKNLIYHRAYPELKGTQFERMIFQIQQGFHALQPD